MEREKIYRAIDYGLPITLVVFYFFTGKLIPVTAYATLAVIGTLYFFPYRFIRYYPTVPLKNNLANLFFSVIVLFSLLSVYIQDSPVMEYVCAGLTLSLSLMIIILFFKFKTNRTFFIAVLLDLLLSEVFIL